MVAGYILAVICQEAIFTRRLHQLLQVLAQLHTKITHRIFMTFHHTQNIPVNMEDMMSWAWHDGRTCRADSLPSQSPQGPHGKGLAPLLLPGTHP